MSLSFPSDRPPSIPQADVTSRTFFMTLRMGFRGQRLVCGCGLCEVAKMRVSGQCRPPKVSLHFGCFRPTMPPMRSEELIRLLRRYARANRLAFSVVRRRGKGSHLLVCVGSRRSYVPFSRELPAGTRQAILRQLGVSLGDLQPVRTKSQPTKPKKEVPDA